MMEVMVQRIDFEGALTRFPDSHTENLAYYVTRSHILRRERAIDEAGDVQFRPSLPFLHVFLVSSL